MASRTKPKQPASSKNLSKKNPATKQPPTKPKPKQIVRPLSVRQERFCELIAGGEVPADAWIKAGYQVSRNVAKSAANRALTYVDVSSRVAQLRKPQTKAATMGKEEKLSYLAELIRIPVGEIGPDSKFCQEYTEDRIAGGSHGKLRRGTAASGNETETDIIIRAKTKMPDKLRALELHSKLCGDFAPEQHVIETGPNTLASLQERAKAVRSGLNLSPRRSTIDV